SDPRTFQLRYQLVLLSPEFRTPKDDPDGNPVVGLMEGYTKELQKNDYLHRYPQAAHRLQAQAKPDAVPTFIGSEACKKCHEAAYAVWQKTPHSHAYQTLVDARRPALRQFDAECIVCHTVGFGYQGGFTDADKTPKLKDVGCESCHGPASEHKKHPNDEH